MVLYFSGTGNSQFVALRLTKLLGEDEAVSINWYLRSGAKAEFYADHPLVFVAPTYAWRLPKVVSDWIETARFDGNRNAYFILTCGGSVGNATLYARRLCERTGLTYRGLASVQMPENYIALSSAPDENECEQMIARAEPVFSSLAQQIRQGEPFTEAPVSPGGRFLSGPFNPLYYSLAIHDKGFTVSDACISCGKCVRRCPLNNISLAGGKPQWNGNCTHCMACICGCPVEAIEYKSVSKGKRRYYIMDDALCYGKEGKVN